MNSSISMLPVVEDEQVARDTGDDASNRNRDELLSALAHAVANSLNTVAAASQLADLLIARRKPDEARKSLERIEPECLRTARLLREGCDALAFGIRPTHDAIDSVALVNACAEPFAGSVEVVADQGLPLLRGDAHALRRMFAEVLNNAFQFGADRVRVTVEPETSGSGVRIGLHDNGPGITASHARIFEPFFSTRPDEHSGLGLALAARIAGAHGGSIGVEDAAHGAAFRVRLPINVA